MTVRLWPLSIVPTTGFGGWDTPFTSQGVAAAGKNNILAVSDTALRRYIGIRFPGVSVNCLESSTKAAPGVWAVPTVLPAAALGILDMVAVPGASPDTLMVGTTTSADGRAYRFILGTGWTNLLFPDSAATDGVSAVSVTPDSDVFLWGSQARAAAGQPSVYTLVLSTLTWTRVGGNGIAGTWTFTQNNGSIGGIVVRAGAAYIIVGNGTANGLEVWRSNGSPYTAWTLIGGGGFAGSWATANKRNGRIVFGSNGRLYAGIGGVAGNAEAWECVGPEGVSPAWTKIGDSTQWASGTITRANVIAAYRNKIVFGTSGTVAGDSQVWEFDTQDRSWLQLAVGTWSRLATGTLYVSPFDSNLFVGVGNNATGTAALFQAVPGGAGASGAGTFFPAPVKVRV